MDDSTTYTPRFQVLESSEALESLSIDDARKYCLVPGDLFWKKKSGRLYRLRKAGDPIGLDELEHFYKMGAELFTLPVVSYELVETLTQFLDDCLSTDVEPLRLSFRDRFIAALKPTYWTGATSASWLNLVMTMHRRLFRKELDELGFEQSPDGFRRSSLIGALNVLGAMSLGYFDEEYLKDIYQLAFFQGLSLKDSITFNLAQALDAERRSKDVFKKEFDKLVDHERDMLDQHAHRDAELVDKMYARFFKFSSVPVMLRWQHERALGTGFPNRVNQEELSDIEVWVSFTSRLFPIKSFEYNRFDGKGAFKSYFDTYRKNKDEFFYMGRRVFQLIDHLWSSEGIRELKDVV
jgi:hypothetical protein